MGLDSKMTLFLLLWNISSVNAVLVSGTGLAAINLKMNLKVENDTIVLKECATGWTPFKEHCYQYFDGYSKNRTYTWLAARDECISHEADLVSIHSVEETDFLTAPRSCSSCVQPSHFSGYTMPEVVTGADGCKSLSCEGYEMMVVEGADWDYDFFEKEVRCSPRGMWESSSGYGGNGTYKQVDDARNLITCAYPVKA